jgi:N-acetylglucosaminyldiphosphoundecaprenol N-acetyl-beta-D-mannosaminyltransferase
MATDSFISGAVGASPALQVPQERLFGLNLCTFDMQEAVAHVDSVLRSNASKVLFTANVDHVVRYSNDEEFRGYYRVADLVFADGTPLLWSARLLRRRLHARVTGVDLMTALCGLAASGGYRCFLLGAKKETLSKTEAVLRQRFPAIQIAGSHHGYFDDSRPVLELIRQARPQLLFVGMGSPRQEKWIADHRKQLSGVVLPVGGSFEVLAGEKKRAPQLMQRLGLEWTWRLAQDPRRLWKRYLLEDLVFLKLFFRELRTQ